MIWMMYLKRLRILFLKSWGRYRRKGKVRFILQVDQSNVFTNNSMSDSVEVMNIGVALDKYHWVKRLHVECCKT